MVRLIRLPSQLTDTPSLLANTWGGYSHFIHKTKVPFSTLQPPSQNCSVPKFDLVLPDKGKTILGMSYDIVITGITGSFSVGEKITGSTSGASCFLQETGTMGLVGNSLYKEFENGETITGMTSGATATLISINRQLIMSGIIGNHEKYKNIAGIEMEIRIFKSMDSSKKDIIQALYTNPTTGAQWYVQLTENNNPIPEGTNEYYCAKWFDTNLNPAKSLNANRLLLVNGYYNTSTKKGMVISWTGGIAPITAVVTNTSLSINSNTSWRAQGFTPNANGDVYIVINGVAHQVPNPADIDTNTVNIASTSGIKIGDIATSQLEMDDLAYKANVVGQVKNYAMYGNWDSKQFAQSNAFNHDSTVSITNYQALQNDIIIPSVTNFNATGSHRYQITIDSVDPDMANSTYTGIGPNDAGFNINAYTGTGNNEYRVTVVSNKVLTLTATVTGWTTGETVRGGTSGALGTIFYAGNSPSLYIIGISGSFQSGETITGQSSGTTGTLLRVLAQCTVQLTKNGIAYTPTPFATAPSFPLLVGTYNLVDGISFVIGSAANAGEPWVTHNVGDTWSLDISKGGTDTFKWQYDGGLQSSSVPITAGTQLLSNGVYIQFSNTQGHQVGDTWVLTADQEITRAFANYYYTLPVRKIGEGYIYNLPSNFWAMWPQEEEMYVNSSYGEWGTISSVVNLTETSSNETIAYTPLKQTSAKKVLYPYLIGSFNDALVFISIDKSLMSISRRQFLEKPQSGYLSDAVKYDFQACSFIGGRLKELNNKLYITSPDDQVMLCFDKAQKYWQPKKTFSNMGILSIVGNDLVCHSPIKNYSYTLFTNSNGDDGAEYTVIARSAASPVNNHAASQYNSKQTNMTFLEALMQGKPPLNIKVVTDLGFNENEHPVDAYVYQRPTNAQLGGGALGSHSFGSDDIYRDMDYCVETYKIQGNSLDYYLIEVEANCTTKNHSYAILSMGVNAIDSYSGNNVRINKNNIFGNDKNI